MNPVTFKNIDSLLVEARKRLDDVDTLSLDIFDTILIRKIHIPDLIKDPVARYITTRAKLLGITTYPASVMELRNEFEAKLRAENGAKHPDHEAHYWTFMKTVLEEIFGDQYTDDLLKDVGDYEIECEAQMISVRQGFADLLSFAKAQGKRTMLVSDMYLPSDMLSLLAEHKEILSSVDIIYSSADTIQAKASGAAYQHLIQTHNLDVHRWLHIGDNEWSDGLKAAEAGIQSLLLKDLVEQHRYGIVSDYLRSSFGKVLYRGRVVQQLMLPLEGENQSQDLLYVDGFNGFSYIYALFMHQLIERVNQYGIKRIYFCSREGWFYLRLWEVMAPIFYPAGNAPIAQYLYTSRLACANAAVGNVGLTEKNLSTALLPATNNTLEDVARVYSIDLEALTPFLEKYQLEATTDIGSGKPECAWRMGLVQKLLRDEEFQQAVKEQGVTSRNAFNDYLEELKFFDEERVAIVDVGWLGSIQHYIVEATSHKSRPSVHGFLLGADRWVEYPRTPDNTLEGLLFDRYRLDLAEASITYIKEIVEETCREPSTGLKAYAYDKNGKHSLIWRANKETQLKEQAQSEYYKPLQDGIVDGTAAYARAINLMGYTIDDLRPWLRALMTMRIMFAKTSEINRIQLKHHVDDFAKDGKKYVVPKKMQRVHHMITLWKEPTALLRWRPFLRLGYYLRHVKRFVG